MIVKLFSFDTCFHDSVINVLGDITQKGYDKKKQLLLGPYLRTKTDGLPFLLN